MVGTITKQLAKMERVREALMRFCREKLGDPSPIIELMPIDVLDFFEAVVISPKFQDMAYSERLEAVSEFLRSAPELEEGDLNRVSRILTEEG